MHEKENESSTAALIAVVLVFFMLLFYVGGYPLLGRREWMPGTKKQARIIVFKQPWQANAYRPMTFFEWKVTGMKTYVVTEDSYGLLSD
jgi:hypothetical protein